jgi:hypothetical protein
MALSPAVLLGQSLHHEAIDWAQRATANGGVVSKPTLLAVSRFCQSVDAAGIRSAMYRLNLFCGGNLFACLVPLYRSASFGGTALGNATDTNVNFVSPDFVETGTGGGLLGNRTSKYLNTGITFAVAPVATISMGAFASSMETTGAANTNNVLIGSLNSSSGFQGANLNAWWNFGSGMRRFDFTGASGGGACVQSPPLASAGFVSASNTSGTSFSLYADGLPVASASATTGVATANQSGPILVFCRNTSGTATSPVAFTGSRIRSYFIGSTLTDSQHASLSAAMYSFQTALGRA